MKRTHASLARRWAARGRPLLIGVTGLVLVLVFSGTVLAQSSPNYNLEWYLIGGGGEVSGSGQFVVEGTAAQSAPGPPYPHSDKYVVSGGFWYGDSPPTFDYVYLPLVMRNH